jgi:probable HAF family extracellular repeat protein
MVWFHSPWKSCRRMLSAASCYSGQVVGSGDNAASEERAFLYSGGKMTDIGTLGGPQATAAAIDNGEIVGIAQTISDADHGFLYTGGSHHQPTVHPNS